MAFWFRTNRDTGTPGQDEWVGPFADVEPAQAFRALYGFQGAIVELVSPPVGDPVIVPTSYARTLLGVPATSEITPAAIGAATPSYVDTRINQLLVAAPAALDTLAELAAALGNDANFAATVTAALAGKAASGHTHAADNDPRLVTFRSSSPQSLTGTSLTAITGLTFNVGAGETHHFAFCVDVTAAGGTSPTHNFQITGPASPTRLAVRRRQMTSATAEVLGVVTAFGTGFGAGAVVANTRHVFEGVLVNGVNSGAVGLSVTPAGTSPTATIGAGSGGYALKVS